jgi:outer membrane protein assembly factor BamD (BamD/ComL family)
MAVRYTVLGLVVLTLAGGCASTTSTPSQGRWVWSERENVYVYVDVAQPPAAPTAETPRVAAAKPEAPPPTAAPTAAPVAPPAPVLPVKPAAPVVEPAVTDRPPERSPTGRKTTTEGGALFEQGRSELAARSFGSAARTFGKLVKEFPNSTYREESLWLRAQAYLGAADPYAAFEELEELLTQYAGSPHYHEALEQEMKIAEAFLTGTHRKVLGLSLLASAEDEGVEILRKVYEHQPKGDLADRVVLRVADYHWTCGHFSDAETYYDKYCHEFPNGAAVKQAELKRAKCAIERCRGPRYDTTGLQLAFDRLSQFQQKYPADAERENVATLIGQVRDLQAQGLYETAAHYRRRSQFQAASFYAERLRERFPESPWSEKAAGFVIPGAAKEEPKP